MFWHLYREKKSKVHNRNCYFTIYFTRLLRKLIDEIMKFLPCVNFSSFFFGTSSVYDPRKNILQSFRRNILSELYSPIEINDYLANTNIKQSVAFSWWQIFSAEIDFGKLYEFSFIARHFLALYVNAPVFPFYKRFVYFFNVCLISPLPLSQVSFN